MSTEIPLYGFEDCNGDDRQLPKFDRLTYPGCTLNQVGDELRLIITEGCLSDCLDIGSEGITEFTVERGLVEHLDGGTGYRIRIRVAAGWSVTVVVHEHSGHGFWRRDDA